jgi:hypothetical protein
MVMGALQLVVGVLAKLRQALVPQCQQLILFILK